MAASKCVRRLVTTARDDRGDIILGWFTRVAVFLLAIGIVAFEALSLVTATVNGADVAQQAASAAADSYALTGTEEAAYLAAEEVALEHEAVLVGNEFRIADDGSVDVALEKTATTLFLFRTEATAKWAVVRSEAHAKARPRT